MECETGRNWFCFLAHGLFLSMLCFVFSFSCLTNVAAADESMGPEAGKIVDARDEAAVKRAGADEWQRAAKGMVLYEGDTLSTGKYGRIYALLSDESLVQINGGTRLVVEQTAGTAGWVSKAGIAKAAQKGLRSVYKLLNGEIWMRNKNRRVFVDIDTPTMVVGVRGTELNLSTDGVGVAVLTVLRGNVLASNQSGEVAATAGRQVVSRLGSPLETTVLLSPEDAVQWTVSMPPGLLNLEKAFASAEEGTAKFPESADLQGYRAALLLKAGRLSEAYERFRELAEIHPENVLINYGLSVSALMINDKETALGSARKSIATDPRDVRGYILESYALQAMHQLPQAMETLEKALAVDGENVTALLNLARLQFGSDYLDRAWVTLAKAEAVSPDSGLVQNLKGFMLLAKRKTGEAVKAFDRALEADSSIGEAHLGLALCRMRMAETGPAMEEMSAAVLLEPRRSLVLSYWAKMLYQLERFDHALDILQLAKELDPNDPTPYLYEGIIHRDLNRPVEAVESLHKAIALNDNRGVYRSRFLMDRDLAVNNVNLFMLYRQLGLSAWAQNKAVSSIKQDYSNYAGHLFYGSALTETGVRTVAGGSELLLARILQPANLNAVNTFNSYTSFFEKPAVDGVVTAAAGNHKTRGYDVNVFGEIPEYNLAFNATNYYKATDGWRETNFEESKGLSALLKFDPSRDDHVTLGYRKLKNRREDAAVGRNLYDRKPNPLDESRLDSGIFEAGYHHRFSPGADFICFFAYVEDDGGFFEFDRENDFLGLDGLNFFSFSDTEYERPYYQFQAQQTFKIGEHQLLGGALRYSAHSDTRNVTEEFLVYYDDVYDNYFFSDCDPDSRLTSFYVRDIWRLNSDWIVEGALYYDRIVQGNPFNGAELNRNELNPRLGVIWTPNSSDTFRLAGFRYVLPFTANRIDPTEIAGVPIFRNTGEGSIAEEIDFVWEREWKNSFLSVGGFYLDRESTSVFVNRRTGAETETDFKGRLKGIELAYNRILGKGVALSAGYRFQDVVDSFFSDYDRKDHLAGVGLNYVRPSGLAASISQAFRYEDLDGDAFENEDIWLTDASLSYEFPGKTGLVSVRVLNIFDNRFNWIEDIFTFQGRAPAREISGSLSVFF